MVLSYFRDRCVEDKEMFHTLSKGLQPHTCIPTYLFGYIYINLRPNMWTKVCTHDRSLYTDVGGGRERIKKKKKKGREASGGIMVARKMRRSEVKRADLLSQVAQGRRCPNHSPPSGLSLSLYTAIICIYVYISHHFSLPSLIPPQYSTLPSIFTYINVAFRHLSYSII